MNREDDLMDFISRCEIDLAETKEEKQRLDQIAYKKHNDKLNSKRDREKYFNSEKGKWAASRSQYVRRINFEKACEDLSWEEKKLIGRFYKNCPEGYQVDHIIPVSRGGKHILSNLQYLTPDENRRKSNKLDWN